MLDITHSTVRKRDMIFLQNRINFTF